jgi:hypothetical protein
MSQSQHTPDKRGPYEERTAAQRDWVAATHNHSVVADAPAADPTDEIGDTPAATDPTDEIGPPSTK